MTACIRESEVLEAVAFDRLSAVREHLDTCASCAEAARVAGALRADYQIAMREAQVPTAGAVWWRATIRARAEAARTVSKPISVAQSVAGASAIGLSVGFAGIAWRWVTENASAGDIISRLAHSETGPAAAVVLQHALPLAIGLAACLVVAPVALYLALSDE